MKVLMINSVCGIRSTGRICTDMAELLEEQGHECKIAYGRETVPQKYQKYAHRIGNGLGVRFDALMTRLFGNSGFNSKSATKQFIQWVRDYAPDVIHLHNIHGYYINVELLFDFLKEYGKPVVWTLHDCWAITGRCAYFSMAGCEKWRTGCHHCQQKNVYPENVLFDNSKRNWERKKKLFSGVKNMTLVTPSKWLAEIMGQSFMGEYPVKVIPNGIDLHVFKPHESSFRKEYGLEDKKIILGVASIWDRRKGYDDFLKLAGLLDDGHRIAMVGVSEKQKQSLPANVIGITRTNNIRELAEIYSSADVLVNPTYEDNYPTVNLEAQACGTPVITYKTGGSVESVPQENVVEQGDLDGLVKKISNLAAIGIGDIELNKESRYKEYIKLFGDCNEAAVFDKCSLPVQG